MKPYIKIKHILALLILCSFGLAGCNEADDVAEIFTGKRWKLTQIYMDDNSRPPQLARDYWAQDEAARNESYRLLQAQGNFVITFEGFEERNMIQGDYSGFVTNATISGTWRADGESHTFSTSQQTANDADVFGRAFMNALKTAYKYSGDSQNLVIYFTEGSGALEKKKYLLLHVDNN